MCIIVCVVYVERELSFHLIFHQCLNLTLLISDAMMFEDEPLPEAEGGDRADYHDLHQGEGVQVQGSDHDAD